MRKNLFLIFFSLLAFGVFLFDLKIKEISSLNSSQHKISNYKKLKVRQIGQYTCWSAIASSLSDYYGNPKEQVEIINDFNRKNANTSDINSPLLSLPITQMSDVFIKTQEVHKISKNQLKKTIDSNVPVVLISNSHVIILIGYEDEDYLAIDPLYDEVQLVNLKNHQYLSNSTTKFDSIMLAIDHFDANKITYQENTVLGDFSLVKRPFNFYY